MVNVNIIPFSRKKSRSLTADINNEEVPFMVKIFSTKRVNKRIDLSKDLNGVYFLNLQTVNGVIIKKIIIQ